MLRSIYRNKWVPPSNPTHLNFTGKTIIVTGSNTGLGAEAAIKFAAQGASRLILGVRSESKAATTLKAIESHSSAQKCKAEIWKLDMNDYNSIRAFAGRCDAELERLDIAVLNAGVYMAEYAESPYGWEETLQVNTLSTTLLALLLLPKLRASRTEEFTPVLEFTSSGTHYNMVVSGRQKDDDSVNILKDVFQKDKQDAEFKYDASLRYRASKLMLMYTLQTLASMIQSSSSSGPDVFVTSVCPGACQSELARGMDTLIYRVGKVLANYVFLRTTEEGSRTLVSGTALKELGHGAFWQNDVIRDPARTLRGEAGEKLRPKVWNEIVEALAKDVPDVRELIAAVENKTTASESVAPSVDDPTTGRSSGSSKL